MSSQQDDQVQQQQQNPASMLQRQSSRGSVADSAMSLNSVQTQQEARPGVTDRVRNMLGGIFRRPSSAHQQQQRLNQMPAQQVMQQAIRQTYQNPLGPGGGFRARQSNDGGADLLRIAVAKVLSSLPPDQRAPLLDLLRQDPSFACLFAYTPGSGARTSVVAAGSARVTEEHTRALAQCKEQVQQTHLVVAPARADGGVSPPGAPGPDSATADGGATPPQVPESAVGGSGSAAVTGEGVGSDAPAVKEEEEKGEGVGSGDAGVPAASGSEEAISLECINEFTRYYKLPTEEERRTVRVVVSLRAARMAKRQSNVAVTCVLDVSGSMAGTRIDLLKETSHFLVQQVTDDDFLGFVSYSYHATVDVPLMRMTPNAKLFAQTVVESLVADGSTALYEGTVQGMHQQLEAIADDLKLAKAVFLCTDGEANVGPRDTDSILPGLLREQKRAGQPCTVHTFGVGDGHSAQVLQAIAEAMSGLYFYLRTAADVPPAYGEALGGLKSVIGKNVRVSVRSLSPGVQLQGVRAGGVTQADNTVVFNDLYAGETRELLLTFNVPAPSGPSASASDAGPSTPVPEVSSQRVAEVVVEYVDPATGKLERRQVPVVIALSTAPALWAPPHPLVLTTSARYETADAIEKAQALQEAGKLKEATELLSKHAAELKGLEQGELAPEAAQQLHMFGQQATVVARTMEESERTKNEAGSSQRQYAVSKTASVGLKQQRAATVGVTMCLPQNQVYDDANRRSARDNATRSVVASMSAKNNIN